MTIQQELQQSLDNIRDMRLEVVEEIRMLDDLAKYVSPVGAPRLKRQHDRWSLAG